MANRISLQGCALKYHFCDSKNIALSKIAYHLKLLEVRTHNEKADTDFSTVSAFVIYILL